MINRLFAVGKNKVSIDIALLLVRVVMGLAFAFYGSFKIRQPLDWMGDDSVFPGFFQALAAISEFCGGIALAAGFLTRLSAFGIGCTMAVATHMHIFVNGDPFVNFTGGGSYDHALLFLVLAILFLITGPGRFSIDYLIFKKRR